MAEDTPQAAVFKVFNTMAIEVYEHAPEVFRKHEVSAFFCGDDGRSKEVVVELARDLELATIDCGALRHAKLLEELADFTRFLTVSTDLGLMMTLSVRNLPEIESPRLGGGQPSAYN